MHNRASSGDQVARVTVINIFSQNVPESSSITTEDKNIIRKAYSTQKVGSGCNFNSGNQVYGRRYTNSRGMVYLIKLTQQKDAIKTIKLSSHITRHQEPIWSVQRPYSVCETAFSQVGLFLD